jgi:hypothetical protein
MLLEKGEAPFVKLTYLEDDSRKRVVLADDDLTAARRS